MKKAYYAPIVIVLLLIITNPTVKDFKDYMGRNTYIGLHRTSNLFIYSNYQVGSDEYVGFLGNFWEHSKPKVWTPPPGDVKVIDSASSVDSSRMDTVAALPLPPPKFDEYGIPIKNNDPLGILKKREDWSKYEVKKVDTIGYTRDGLPILKKESDPFKEFGGRIISEIPYKDRVYLALKENQKDFALTKNKFDIAIKDRRYAIYVYAVLKNTLSDFNKTQEDFLSALGLK